MSNIRRQPPAHERANRLRHDVPAELRTAGMDFLLAGNRTVVRQRPRQASRRGLMFSIFAGTWAVGGGVHESALAKPKRPNTCGSRWHPSLASGPSQPHRFWTIGVLVRMGGASPETGSLTKPRVSENLFP